ncbi:glucan 1,4-alpha-glucosidase (glucoamylase) [Sulfobacillus acidophilus TPY]|uniref:Glucoamylase n=1 Tax=Sulfobacillus acidophilus (strain ATCC 700253 / DSM 10332 / NAL) TaxID=679936 RepID=G8TS94_SULAD|nr:glucan 1,4-alpha-glucosidase (glucoamylase) [Sulfobacillus acidophilus TPY]AEW05506.1 glucoamylase [Sulfobacillus acidophilus DSM 10332]
MPRDLPLGNGNLLITFDSRYHLRDVFFPLVGQENHTAGHYFRLGVGFGHQFSWVHDAPWICTLMYEPRTLMTRVTLRHPVWRLEIQAQDAVDMVQNVLVRRLVIRHEAPVVETVTLFFTQDFHIYGLDVGDTAFYDPVTGGVVHYKRERYFTVNGQIPGSRDAGVSSYSTGNKETAQAEGTWRDAEDGQLGGNPIAQGSVDSAIGLSAEIEPGQEAIYHVWLCAGKSLEEVRRLDGWVRFRGVEAILDRTRAYWKLWGDPDAAWVPDKTREECPLTALESPLADLYIQSLLIMRTHIDNRGAIIAANDSDVMHYARDTYSYMWPRDGAFVAMAFDRAGYEDIAQRFFDFCREVIEPEGYFLHKYNPDRTLSSSWHPWYRQGQVELPIQEDETGLVLISLWEFFKRHRQVETIKPWFRPLIVNAGQFLADYRDSESGLPLPSWDLWEERHGIHAFTVSTVYGGLMAAHKFAQAFGEVRLGDHFWQAAQSVQQAFRQYFLEPEHTRWLRSLRQEPDGTWMFDTTWDASLLLLWRWGLVESHEEAMKNTAAGVYQHLWVPGPVGGLARYQQDPYQRVDPRPEAVGNPWFVCTLWYGEYLVRTGDLDGALALLRWARQYGLPSGVLAEQLHPDTGHPVSVAPLTWSHAEYVWTTLSYLNAQRARSPFLRGFPPSSAAETR